MGFLSEYLKFAHKNMMLTSLTYLLDLNVLNLIVISLLTNDKGFISLSAPRHHSLLESQLLSRVGSYMLSAPFPTS